MDTVDDDFDFDNGSFGDEARSLSLSIEVIRRARGRKNPRDCIPDSEEWAGICVEFVRDLRWALGMSDDEFTNVPRTDD